MAYDELFQLLMRKPSTGWKTVEAMKSLGCKVAVMVGFRYGNNYMRTSVIVITMTYIRLTKVKAAIFPMLVVTIIRFI